MFSTGNFQNVQRRGKQIMLFGSIAALALWGIIGLYRGNFEKVNMSFLALGIMIAVPLVVGAILWMSGAALAGSYGGHGKGRRSNINPNVW